MQVGSVKKKSSKYPSIRGRGPPPKEPQNDQFFSPNLRVQMPKMNMH